ncbi:MAG TPA: hypothetical protein VFZ69_13325 [Longimicrobiales bacterium]
MRSSRTVFRSLLLASALLASAVALEAQTVELRGRGEPRHDRFLRQLIRSGEVQLIVRDTLLGRNDTIAGTVLVMGSTMRLEGVIAGDLVVVDANVFVRPTARVLGDMHNIGGGLYYSEVAAVTGQIHTDPNAPYRVEVIEEGRFVIQGMTRDSPLILYGLKGLQMPTYDRVDGLTLGAAAGYAFPLVGDVEPILRGRVDYRFERSQLTGGAELAAARRRTEVAVGAERTTVTNERWIRNDITNSISSLVQAKDRRDYYAADRAYVEVRRLVERTERVTNVFLRGQVEDATPLIARDPWSISGEFRSDNIAVTDSRITSAIAGLNTSWTYPRHVLELSSAIELGTGLLEGDHDFGRYELDATWAMAALSNHTLTIEPHVQGPLPGTDSLPLQRWSFVGGSGTLYTFDVAEFRGDRVAFVETEYDIPLPTALRIRFLGLPHFQLLHMAGMAWSHDEEPAFEQNIGVRLRFNALYLRAVTHPSRFSDDVEFAIGVSFPRRSLPWQTGQ